MIRPQLFKAVMESLSSHPYLSQEDFTVREFENSSKQPCLAVQYRYDPKLFFNFHVPTQRTRLTERAEGVLGAPREVGLAAYRFNCTVRPGRESVEETITVEERSGLISEITDWLRRVYDDVVAAPTVRQFQVHAAAIDELNERLSRLPDDPLSREDIEKFSAALESLKAEVSEQLKQDSADKDDLKQRVDELSKDIAFLKQTLASMTKREWGKLLAARLHKWKNRFTLRQISSTAKVAKLLLPNEAGPAVDTFAQVLDGVADVIEQKAPKDSGAS